MKIGKILKYCFVAFALFVLGFLAIRILMTSDRTTLTDIYPTEEAVRAYALDGDSAFVSFNLPDDMSRDGYFTAYSPAYCKSTGEYQITIRYNDSLSKNYLKGSDPEKYYFELRDKDGSTVSKSRCVAEKERYFYNYLRLSFTGINVTDGTELYLFLCCDECEYPAKHTEGLLVAHTALEGKTIKISSNEKKALSEKN